MKTPEQKIEELTHTVEWQKELIRRVLESDISSMTYSDADAFILSRKLQKKLEQAVR